MLKWSLTSVEYEKRMQGSEEAGTGIYFNDRRVTRLYGGR